MDYQKVTKEKELDLRLPNESFDLVGKLDVSRVNNEWLYDTELFDQTETMTFPDEDYKFEDVHEKGFAIGAYENNICVALAVYEHNWNKYLFLNDLKVNREFRKQGVASELIKQGQAFAQKFGYKGIYTIGQDNNLAACQFYLKQGFVIGGLNTNDYKHTPQEGKADIYFYLENKS